MQGMSLMSHMILCSEQLCQQLKEDPDLQWGLIYKDSSSKAMVTKKLYV